LDDAKERLHGVLQAGPMNKAEIVTFARREGISDRTLDRAKDELSVVSERDISQRGRPATWRLPFTPTVICQDSLADNETTDSSEVACSNSGVSCHAPGVGA